MESLTTRYASRTNVLARPYLPTLTGGLVAADAVLGSGAAAVVCHNDMLAIGLMRRLAERGRSVPRDVSVVGFDNVFGAEFCQPALTTLGERTEEAGTRAVELLAQQVPTRQVEGPTRVLATSQAEDVAPVAGSCRRPGMAG